MKRSGITRWGILSLAAFAAMALLCFSGCASTPQGRAVALRMVVSTGGTPALANNPRYIPVAEALVAGIDVALERTPTVTAENIRTYVRRICALHGLDDAETAVFVNLAQTVFVACQAELNATVVRSTDPVVRMYALAFKDGLRDALAALGP